MGDLAQRLGYAPEDRILIVSCDDLGFSHAANVGVYEALRTGAATSASLIVCAPWARGAAAEYRGEDVGVHLTLNSEHDLYRWGPITHAPSLLDGDGGFPRTIEDVWDHADLDEVRREWRAQLERAIYWGFEVTHLDAHLAGVELKPEFFDIYLDLAEEFRLPLRLPATGDDRLVGFPARKIAEERSMLAPDFVTKIAADALDEESLRSHFETLQPGVTELRVHPAVDTPELRAAALDWAERVAQADLVGQDGPIGRITSDLGITRIGYRPLRALLR